MPPAGDSEAPPARLPTHDPALNSTRCSGDTIGERGVCAETGKNAGVPVRRSAIWVTRPRAFWGRFIFCQARVTPGAICLSNSSHLPPRAPRAPTSALRRAPRLNSTVRVSEVTARCGGQAQLPIFQFTLPRRFLKRRIDLNQSRPSDRS